MGQLEDLPSLRAIRDFAAEQAEFLKDLFEQDDQEFATLSVVKLQEEVGEVAEAFLALRKMQRSQKLQRSRGELRAALGREIGDVAIVIALLADAVGLSFDEVLLARVDDIVGRREKLLADRKQREPKSGYKRDVIEPVENSDQQLDLFAALEA